MKLEDVEKIIKMFEKSSVSSIDLEIDNIKIKLEKNDKIIVNNNITSNKRNEVSEEIVTDDKKYITSPLVGTFHQAPFADAKPFVSIGQKVSKGEKLCIIEAMKVMNEITAPYDGTITNILVKEGQMVEFGQQLFEIGE